MSRSLHLLLALVFVCGTLLLPSCDDGENKNPPSEPTDTAADLTEDGKDTEVADTEVEEDSDEELQTRPVCGLLSERAMLPSPAWEENGPLLTPPAGDRAVAMLAGPRPEWAAQLDQLDGWPRRPQLIIALDGQADAVDLTTLALYGDVGGTWTLFDEVRFEGKLVGGDSLVIHPVDPLPYQVSNVILAFTADTLSGAAPLPACSAPDAPHPAYAEALAALPAGAAATFALPFRLADTPNQLARLAQTLSTTPALAVDSAELTTLSTWGEYAPTAAVAAHLAPEAAHLILSTPAYQNADGTFALDASGVPVAQSTTHPGVVVLLPAAGTAPYPFVLYQHGGSQNKMNVTALAGPLAEQGFALVAVDLPSHGDRAGPGGGDDLDILVFDDPLMSRDNLRQASADHLAILTGIEALNVALQSTMGVANILDQDRTFYMGLSLGAITGSFTSSMGLVDGAALFVGGGGFDDILSGGFFSFMLSDILSGTGLAVAARFAMVEMLLEGADPLGYPALQERNVAPGPMLFFQAKEDPIIAAVSNDQWARAFGAALARPFDHAVVGMSDLALPTSNNFAWTAGGIPTTRVLVQAPMAEVGVVDRHAGLIVQDYSQTIVANCFAGILSNGECEVIDTGFVDH